MDDIREIASQINLGPLSWPARDRLGIALSDYNIATDALKAAYASILTERIPDEIRELIEKLR